MTKDKAGREGFVPVSVEEARYVEVKLKRSGRQRGGWVYLDEDLLRRAGIDPAAEIGVRRYALPGRSEARKGKKATQPQVILKLRLLGQQPPEAR